MYEYKAQIVRVIDGDTVEAIIDLGFKIQYRTNVRLAEMNAPEINTEEGKQAKIRLIALCEEQPNTIIHSKSLDKYGRVLGVIYVNTLNVNQQMIIERYATAV